MLRWRLLLGAVLITLVAALGWADLNSSLPSVWLLPLAVIAALAGSGELLWMTRNREARPLPWVVYTGNMLIVLSNWIGFYLWKGPSWDNADFRLWIFPVLAFAFGVGLSFVGEMSRYQKPGGITERIAMSVLALAYIGVLMSFVIQLRFLPFKFGIPALASLIIVVKMCDIGAYTVGRLIGRHKMAPVLSPGKTFEGAVGGIVFACAGAWLALQLLLPKISSWPVESPRWISYGVLVGLTGMLGDLAESLLKRDLGCKDSSPWMPGFGGVLDILDSILLAAPVAYACWWLGLVV